MMKRDLQEFLRSEIERLGPIRLSELVPQIEQYLGTVASQSDRESGLRWSLAVLREMQDAGWVRCRFADKDIDETKARVEWESKDRLIIEVTQKGREHLVSNGRLPPSRRSSREVPPDTRTISDIVATKRPWPREPESGEAARKRIADAIAQRQGQPKFREDLLRTYRHCLVTGCDAEAVLEAAHICPYSKSGTFAIANGLLLRADIHTLFDLGLIAIETADMTVVIARQLEGTAYSEYAGKPLLFTRDTAQLPSRPALDQHRKEADL